MHGRVKVRTTAEQEAIKKIEREKKVKKYKSAINIIFQKRKAQEYDDELLALTEAMVLENADLTSLWNIRREIFEQRNWIQEEYIAQLEKELNLTVTCLKQNPKSYSVWHHRFWVIEHLPSVDWKAELALCTKYLELDERNFHCWDYRQMLVQRAGISDDEELKFSTKKIYKNFSNYSSWHYRSQLLSRMFPNVDGSSPIIAEKQKEELNLVMNATFTDPADSSSWFYQFWLLHSADSSPETLWWARVNNHEVTVIFHENTSAKDLVLKENSIDGDNQVTSWNSPDGQNVSKVWFAILKTYYTSNEPDLFILKHKNKSYRLYKSQNESAWDYKSPFNPTDRPQRLEMKELMDQYKELATMTSDNKWVLLTGILLMKNYDFLKFYREILKDLDVLMEIDSLRINYYADLRSRFVMEYEFNSLWRNHDESQCVDLSKRGLTLLFHEQYLTFSKEVNLAGNRLGHSLHRLAALTNCRVLILDDNKLENLRGFRIKGRLKYLSLRGNCLRDVIDILNLLATHRLELLDLRGNPIASCGDDLSQIQSSYPNLELLT